MSPDLRTLKPSAVKAVLAHCIERRRPAFVWGPPGIGKSDIVWQIGQEQNRPVIDIRLLLMDPTDLRGMPYYNPTSGKMEWAPPGELPDEPSSSAIVFFDELNAAAPSVQGAAYQLILNRRIGSYELPENAVIIAAGNRETDRSVTFRMPSALANRFIHFEMRHDFDDWQNWAVQRRIHKEIVGYLSFQKEDLMRFEPKSASRAFASPRTWMFLSDLIDDGMSYEMQTDIAIGCVGDAAGNKFMQYRKVAAHLPNPTDILNGTVRRLDRNNIEISALHALVTGMCYELKEAHDRELEEHGDVTHDWHRRCDFFLAFMMENMEAEYTIMGSRIALGNMGLPFEPRQMRMWDAFSSKYEKMILRA